MRALLRPVPVVLMLGVVVLGCTGPSNNANAPADPEQYVVQVPGMH